MSAYTTKDIRNIALVGHAGAGKTYLTESLLHSVGVINAKGSIEKGTTVTDFDPLEKEHQHSLSSSLVSFDHNQSHINLIDTPGYPDFLGPTLSALPAVETIAIVVNAHNGIETNTRKMFDWATEHNFCRMFIINNIDAEDTDLESLYADIQGQFGSECLALNLPAAGATEVVDCFFNPSGEADFSSVEDAHTSLVDQTVEVDEELMTLYLDQGEVSPEQLHDPFEQAMREGHLIPVCFVSAETGVGIKQLMDIIDKLMPNPLEANAPTFVNGGGDDAETAALSPDASLPVVAHVFKIAFDPFVGKLSAFRVHQGSINKDSQLFVGDARKAIKMGHIYSMLGKEQNEVGQCIPGDIRVVTKVDGIELNSVLHDSHENSEIRLKPLPLPQPMVGLAIEPKSRGDEQKVSDGIHRLIEEDPCITLERNTSANETVLRGLGDLHLRIALERMQTQYNVEVATHAPSIPYLETITKSAEGHCRHKKQTGGAGQFGEVFLRVEPVARGKGYEFVNKIVGGSIPSQFIPAVEKGVQQVLETGAFAGYPMQDIRVTVYDGKFHAVDSKEVAFVAAGKKAFIDAVNKARPIILEPIVEVEVNAPNSCMGDITGDLASRRGRVNSTDSLKGDSVSIIGFVPLSEMEDYPSRLKSITAGEGTYSVQLSSYEPTSADMQKKLQAGFSHADED